MLPHPNQRIRACQNCSRRKKKCSGTRPQCSLCTQAGTICIYPSFTLKPGPRKGYRKRASTNNGAKEPQRPQEVQASGSILDHGEWEGNWPPNASGQMTWSQSSFSDDAFQPGSSLGHTVEATALATTSGSVPSQLLCHMDASFLKGATSMDHSEAPIDPALALYQESNTQSSTGAESLPKNGFDGFDYTTKDAGWVWPEGFTGV